MLVAMARGPVSRISLQDAVGHLDLLRHAAAKLQRIPFAEPD